MKKILLTLILCLFVAPSFAQESTPSDLTELLQDRVLGDPEAPVTLVDHSSLTCPHCKSFHVNILPKIKERFIDTGKVKLVYADFPLNGPALQASMVARCFQDDETYFQYINFLFETQDSWAPLPDPRPYLAQNARLLGIGADELDACMKTAGYQDAFIKKIQETREIKQVQSTPTFIIAETDQVIVGAKTFMIFETAINSALEKAK